MEKVDELDWIKLQNIDMKIELNRRDGELLIEAKRKLVGEMQVKYKFNEVDSINQETLEIIRNGSGKVD